MLTFKFSIAPFQFSAVQQYITYAFSRGVHYQALYQLVGSRPRGDMQLGAKVYLDQLSY